MISFDVFDTLITRKTLTPSGIFALMQSELMRNAEFGQLPVHIRESFVAFRIQAEELARLSNQCMGKEEVTLQDIYEAMAMHGNIDAKMQARLCELECRVECENVLPIPRNIALLKEKLQQGERVVLISDMYLSGEIIHRMLVNADEVLAEVPLYISGDLGLRKTTGNLYRKVGELEQVDYEDWTHYGDNLFQDIQKAGELGIKTVHLSAEPPTVMEQTHLSRFRASAVFQLLSGTSRYTRYVKSPTETANTSVMGQIAYEMGCSVSGPILYSYVEWILQEAVRKDIKRLYFIARDGYFPKLVADKMIAAKDLEIETSYIYGSRKAWRFCSLSEEHFNLRELFAWSYVNRLDTIPKLASLLELSVAELMPFLPFGCRLPDAQLTSGTLYEVVRHLEESADFRHFYLEKQSAKRELAVAYIRQEVDMRDDAFAFADVSGGGLTQGCLRNLMSADYDKPITTFFFKLDRVNLVPGCIYDVFFPSMLQNNLVIEMICRAPHGQTLCYERVDGKVMPVLDEFENQSLEEHGFVALEQGIADFTDNMLRAIQGSALSGGVISVVEAYLDYVAHRPDEKVLEYFSSFPNNESGRDSSFREYAPRLTEEEIRKIFLGRMYWEDTDKYYKGTNLEYSLLRSTEAERKLAEWCKQNYDSEEGRALRLERQQEEDALRGKYGLASYYFIELLEENIVLYGAGRMGRKLYRRLQDVGGYRIVKWIDKKLHGDYPPEVDSLESLAAVAYDQVVIAVASRETADEMIAELVARGVERKKIFWTPVYGYRNPWFDWNKAVYGD